MDDLIILDASVIAKLVVDEEHSSIARLLFDDERFLFAAPSHALAEALEVVCRKVRAKEATPAQLSGALLWLPGSIVTIAIERLAAFAVDMSLETGASIYDSLYVALAVERDTWLVTADARLEKTFRQSSHHKHIVMLANAGNLPRFPKRMQDLS